MALWENYFSGKFVNAAGKVVTKTATSMKKSNNEQKKELIEKMKNKGYKYVSGSMGSRQK